MPVPETDVEVGYSVAEAMGYMVTIVMVRLFPFPYKFYCI
jgi:predicted phosphoribosyltransferase